MRYYVCCFIVGVLLAQAFEAWHDRTDWPPVALCPNYEAVRVSTNQWRIDAPTRTIAMPECPDISLQSSFAKGLR